jgi:hypothetical protein
MKFIKKVKGFLTKPSKTFDAVKDSSFNEALRYYIILLVIYSAIIAILIALISIERWGLCPQFGFLMKGHFAAGKGIDGALVIFIVNLIYGITWIFINGMIIHLGVKIMGGKRGVIQTLKAIIYGSTPFFLFGWIPNIGIIFIIWSLVAVILGIQELQELPTRKAIVAPFIVYAIIVLIITVTWLVIGFLKFRQIYILM